MPDTIREALNGSTASAVSAASNGSVDRHRPKASTATVYEEVMRSLASVVTTALSNAGSFVYLGEHYDRDATTAVRLGHLVDATECVEIAMTHLGQLKAVMSNRLRAEDEQHAGEPPY